jgi:VIT1/CCC1 family predicted Fe2+/Mn2+ transporter
MKITNLISKNPQAFVDIMMAEELGITGGDEHPKINALVTFIAYVLFGFMPCIRSKFYAVLPYVVSVISGLTEQLFLISCILTGAFLFILGVTKSMFSYSKWYMQGGETLFTGGIAAALAYLIGWGFSLIAERN